MNRFIFLTILMCAPIAWAETPVNQGSNDLKISVRSQTDDEVIAQVLATPFEMRQYTVPMLHESLFTSKKVRTHPDIAYWKAKIPTRVAPQLAGWAKEHLAFLPARYYWMVMPENFMPKNTEIENKYQISTAAFRELKDKMASGKGFKDFNKAYPPSKKSTDPALKPADIQRVKKTIDALNQFYEQQPDQLDFKKKMVDGFLAEGNLQIHMADPFASLVVRLQKAIGEKQTDDFFKKQGWESSGDFALKTDRLLKAYRANFLSLPVAIELNKARKIYKPSDQNESARSMWMYARFFDASKEDTEFAAPRLNELGRLFWNKDKMVAGAMVYLDFPAQQVYNAGITEKE